MRGETMSPTSAHEIRELDRRRNHGVDVALLWNSITDRLFVSVQDERNGGSFEVEVAATDALDAFRHPFVYA
jgi:hypothetical protein